MGLRTKLFIFIEKVKLSCCPKTFSFSIKKKVMAKLGNPLQKSLKKASNLKKK
jgi:hypothetical protein